MVSRTRRSSSVSWSSIWSTSRPARWAGDEVGMIGSSLLLAASVCGWGPAPRSARMTTGRARRLAPAAPRLSRRQTTGHDRSMNGANGHKQLVRPREGRMIAGVCAGIGDYFGIDANVVRIIFAALTIFSVGAGALVYLIAWAVLPEEGEKSSIVENYLNKKKSG